ncbi:MAG: DUF1629 domain-containing protein [Acidobacteriota bacterium]
MAIKIWTHWVGSERDFTDADFRNADVLDDVDVMSGRPLSHQWPTVQLDVETRWAPADAFRCGPLLIASAGLVAILKKWSEASFEALPVEVFFKGEVVGQYFNINILRSLDVLDRVRSRFTLDDDGDVDEIESVAIDPSRVVDEHFFEIDASEWVICVSLEVSAEIEAAGLRGVRLIDPSEWSLY